MKNFSISAAAAEPFRQAGRRPVTTMVWGLLMILPSLGVIAAMIPLFGQMAAAGAFDPGADPGAAAAWEPDFATAMQVQAWSNLASMLQMVASLFITTAIIRAVFAGRRGDKAFFLRVGLDELHVAVVAVALGVGAMILVVIAVLFAVAIGAALWGLNVGVRVPLYVLMGLGLFFGFILLWGRLALLAPASLKYRTFAFVEGWALGKGQTWRLFGLMIVMVVVMILIGVAAMILFFIAIFAVGGGLSATDPEAVEAWFEAQFAQPTLLIGVGLVLLLPLGWLQGFSALLATAPFARVVEDLAEAKAARAAANSADTAPDPL